jgi:hypothetical protein
MNAHSLAEAGSRGLVNHCTAFQGTRRIAGGELDRILPAIKSAWHRDPQAPLLVFEDATGNIVELDLRDEAAARPGARTGAARRAGIGDGSGAGDGSSVVTASGAARGVGRPKLGVVAREVTLLPRHWDWLSRQPGGASVTLRKLVEEARRSGASRDRVRRAQEVTYRFLLAIGGNLPGYEEAMRALFAARRGRFEELLAAWPSDIRDHALRLAADAFPIDE